MRALIVDDSHTARLVMIHHLQGLGFEVQQAMDGSSALEALRQGPRPDLMTLDWNMPGMSGGQILEVLRHEKAIRPGKILIVTSETELAMVGLALALGGDEYLMKPSSAEAVREKVLLLGLAAHTNATPGRD